MKIFKIVLDMFAKLQTMGGRDSRLTSSKDKNIICTNEFFNVIYFDMSH